MGQQERETQERILEAALRVMERVGVSRTTVRRVAEEAGVGLGLINYHFGTKDELIHQAVSRMVGDRYERIFRPYQHPEVDPETRLRRVFREVGRLIEREPDYLELFLSHELLAGEFETAQRVLPLIREIFGQERRELELRLLAYSLVVSLQIAAIRPEAFRRYTGLDLGQEGQRDLAFEMMVNAVVGGGGQ
ncbi:MAG: TetR/AcrR family transcriptional regulator [Anaerolineales bacterium]